MTSEKQT